MRKYLILGPWLLLIMAPQTSGEEPGGRFGIPAGTSLRELCDRPRVIHSAVSAEQYEQQKEWIDLDIDLHICADVPLANLRAVLLDYTNYPKNFKRYKETALSQDERGLYQHITVSIGLMGFSFDTRYTLLSHTPIDTPDAFAMTWTHAGDDGSIKNIRGNWYLQAVMVDNKPYTYIRYAAFSTAVRKFPLQRMVMNMFKDLEHFDMLKQFIRAGGRSGPR
ncbi:MAG: hypothetical protein LBD37_07965 [Treponema sp.]|jgi:hypothetical protein|nr:hypothetical protein [Treponema sp.]